MKKSKKIKKNLIKDRRKIRNGVALLSFIILVFFGCCTFSFFSSKQKSVRPPESLKKAIKARISGQIEKTKAYVRKVIQPYINFYKSRFTPPKQDGMDLFMKLYYFGLFKSMPPNIPSLHKTPAQPK